VMSYQLGTNWSDYSRVLGNILGPLIGYEVLGAFFLEATFLGIMLFGWGRVPRFLHFMASLMVVLGTTLSAFWILSANSWMQTPAGFEMRDGIAYPTDWILIILNPSFPYRFAHMVVASYLTVAFIVAAVGAGYWLAGRFSDQAQTMLRMGLGLALLLAPLQALIGDFHGLNTLKYQPAKIAAIEAHWENVTPVPAASIVASLVMLVLIYGVVFTAGAYYINRLIRKGPDETAAHELQQGVPLRPISVAQDAGREALKARGPALAAGSGE
jgi:cytochrome bd ubiquinol oxidase subunit I